MLKIENRIIFDGVKESKSLSGMPMINDANYYDDRMYLTNSMLGKLLESPVELQQYLSGGSGLSTTSLTIGDAVHKGILEPEKFKSMVVTWNKTEWPVPTQTIRTAANKEWMENFYLRNKDKCVLSEDELLEVNCMIYSFNSKPYCKEALKDSSLEQISLAVVEGIPMKSKGDIIKNNKKCFDIKTSIDASVEGFRKSCEMYGYYRQAGLYSLMFDVEEFEFLVIEKKAPYRVVSFVISGETLDKGRKEALDLINKFKHFFVDDVTGTYIEEYVPTHTI